MNPNSAVFVPGGGSFPLPASKPTPAPPPPTNHAADGSRERPRSVVALLGRKHGLNVLENLIASRGYTVKAVFTHRRLPKAEDPERAERPDFHLYDELCKANAIPLYWVDGVKQAEEMDRLLREELGPFDCLLACSWRRIIPPHHLTLARYPGINLHRGELPAFKGAEPVRQALLAGADFVEISGHILVEEVDAGRVIARHRHPANWSAYPDLDQDGQVERVKSELTPYFGPLAIRTLDQLTFQHSEAFLFDMDGVLANTRPALTQVYHDFVAKHRAASVSPSVTTNDEEFQELDGPSIAEIVSILGERYGFASGPDADGNNALVAEYKSMVKESCQNSPAMAGAVTTVRQLAGCGARLALVTSSPRVHAQHFLTSHGIADCFEVIVTGDDVNASKPSPDIYLRAQERLRANRKDDYADVSPLHFTVIEDSYNGVLAAISADCQEILWFQPDPAITLFPHRANVWMLETRKKPDTQVYLLRALPDILQVAQERESYVRIESVSNSIEVHIGDTVFAPADDGNASVRNRIDEIWDQELAKAGELFNGPVLHVHKIVVDPGTNHTDVHVQAAEYKHYLAKRRDPSLPYDIRPLGVSGLVLHHEGGPGGRVFTVAAQRHQATAYRGYYELVPSGSLTLNTATDYKSQLLTELVEETTLEQVTSIRPLCVTLDLRDNVFDICCTIQVPSLQTTETSLLRGAEYRDVHTLDVSPASPAWADFTSTHSMVATSQAVMYAYRVMCENA